MESELKSTSRCSQWFWNTFPEERGMLVRVKNELDNHPYKTAQDRMKQLAENKATGIIPGASDFYLILCEGRTDYIELKTETGSQSKEQKEWQEKIEKRGHKYHVVYSFEQFKKLVLCLLRKEMNSGN